MDPWTSWFRAEPALIPFGFANEAELDEAISNAEERPRTGLQGSASFTLGVDLDEC